MAAAQPGSADASDAGVEQTCSCCRTILIREPHLARTPKKEAYTVWMCPVCDDGEAPRGNVSAP